MVPYLAQNPAEVGGLIRALNDHAKGGKGKGGFSVKTKRYNISDNSGRTVDSWQLQDWEYKKSNLPTYARGLFTHNNNDKPEIAVRGYDKFFNVEEVSKTRWRNIEHNTRGPYELSVKENGCIIFIAGLDDQTLIVTSKHSTGPRTDATANHAIVGESWIDQQLSAIGKTRSELAKELRQRNVTAVAELCDDSFEEHVLEYKPDQAGLYLHGINLNLPEFATYSSDEVAKFADQWGFRKVMYVIKDTIDQVKPFLEEVAQTGNYDGRDTEGFVIRCQVRNSPQDSWEDWFYKYKFEEPYLMYRQWRECTKAIIAGKQPRYKKHKKITEEYLLYARQQIYKDPDIGKRYNENHGIIALRNGFLDYKGVQGSDIIRSELAGRGDMNTLDVTKNIVLVPIATIGCGKTTVALALVKLFGWGHEQNDNIQGKGNRPPKFAMATTNSLTAHPVVIADRNNHQRREREQIIHDVQNVIPEARFVALHWVHDRSNYSSISRATQERVFSRGDNHQTIQAGSKSRDEIMGIMDGFLKRFEPLDATRTPDEEFDLVVDLDVTSSSRENLETVVKSLHHEYPKLFDMPSADKMDVAIEAALNDYKPDIKHDLSRGSVQRGANNGPKTNENWQERQDGASTSRSTAPSKPSKPRSVEYFSLSLPTARINAILDAVSRENHEMAHFLGQLKFSRRVQGEFHVTLIHRASVAQHADHWNRLNDILHQSGGKDMIGKAMVHLERVVWDDRLMAIVVRLLDAEGDANGVYKSVNQVAHVTIGTAASSIKPKESNDLLARWLKGGDAKISEVNIKGDVVLEGSAKVVLSR